MTTKNTSKPSKPSNSSNPIVVGLIYAKWCEHCKSMKDDWKKLEGDFANNENIQIIKIDEANPDKVSKMNALHPELVANGYPTIFKISGKSGGSDGGGGNIEYFSGDRTYDSLRQWSMDSSNSSIKAGGCGCGRGKRNKKTHTRRRNKRKYYTKKSRKN